MTCFAVKLQMVLCAHCHEVFNAIVSLVLIDMMDMEAARNRSVVMLPYGAVHVFDTGCFAAVVPALRVEIIPDALEFLPLVDNPMVSPCTPWASNPVGRIEVLKITIGRHDLASPIAKRLAMQQALLAPALTDVETALRPMPIAVPAKLSIADMASLAKSCLAMRTAARFAWCMKSFCAASALDDSHHRNA